MCAVEVGDSDGDGFVVDGERPHAAVVHRRRLEVVPDGMDGLFKFRCLLAIHYSNMYTGLLVAESDRLCKAIFDAASNLAP